MGEGIALGVPLGFLHAIAQSRDFREVPQPAGRLKHLQPARGPEGFDGPFLPFGPDALDGQLGKRPAHAPAKGRGFRRQGQVKAGGELHGPQDPEGIVHEGGAGVAQDAGLQVRAAAMRIYHLVGEGIVGDGIDREIAPCRRIGIAEQGVGHHGKTAVAAAGLGFAPRQAEIILDAAAPELDHAEAAADHIGGAKGGQRMVQFREAGSGHLDVKIGTFDP